MAVEPELHYRVENHVGLIVLSRPERKNAFTPEMIDLWAGALDSAAADQRVRAVIVTGAGDSFCSGVDLEVMAQLEPTPLAHKQLLTDCVHRVAQALDRLDKPVVAAIRGAAVGAGLDMALLCDMRFAGRSLRASEGYIKVGLVAGDGGAWLLPRLVGQAKALELLLTGDTVDADEALRIGLVNRVYDDDELLDRTTDFARQLAAAPPVQVAMMKRAVRQARHVDLATHLDLISSHFAVVSSTDDYREARAAFRERRAGDYTGR
jgi:enoyl-CoA hydratase/carnithine racemase